jgi:hypothetical protein
MYIGFLVTDEYRGKRLFREIVEPKPYLFAFERRPKNVGAFLRLLPSDVGLL